MLRRVAVVRRVFLRSVFRLMVTSIVAPSSPILVTSLTEAIRSSETSVLQRATRRNIPEEGILHKQLFCLQDPTRSKTRHPTSLTMAMILPATSRFRFLTRSFSFSLPNPSSLREISTRNLPEGKGRTALEGDNHSFIC
jgi:hypothetical protein